MHIAIPIDIYLRNVNSVPNYVYSYQHPLAKCNIKYGIPTFSGRYVF